MQAVPHRAARLHQFTVQMMQHRAAMNRHTMLLSVAAATAATSVREGGPQVERQQGAAILGDQNRSGRVAYNLALAKWAE